MSSKLTPEKDLLRIAISLDARSILALRCINRYYLFARIKSGEAQTRKSLVIRH